MKVGQTKMSCIMLTRNFPPTKGGMERFIEHVVSELTKYARMVLIAPEGSRQYAPPSVSVVEVPLNPIIKFFRGSFWALWRQVRTQTPDLLIGGSGLVAPLLWLVSRLKGVPSVCFIHGLDLVVEHRIYQALFLPAIRRMDLLLVNSESTRQIAIQKGALADRCVVIHPGVELVNTEYTHDVLLSFSNLKQLAGRQVILSVGRLVKRKGLHHFIRHILPGIVKRCPNVVLVIVGTEPVASLKKEKGYLDLLKETVTAVGMGSHVRFFGEVSDDDLKLLYQIARVLIFPLQEVKGDVEGFGMVAVEAASHGLPTVAFRVGGVADAVSHEKSGYLVEPGNDAYFARCVLNILENDELHKSLSTTSKEFVRQFSWNAVGLQIKESLEKLRV